jgi:DNA invertase Pin-like site-specific DNA recombinase
MAKRNDGYGGPQFSNIGLSRPLLHAACKAQAEEAQRQIDARHARAALRRAPRRSNSRYSDEVVAQARELHKRFGPAEISRQMGINLDTIQRWLNGTTRGMSAATAKRIK